MCVLKKKKNTGPAETRTKKLVSNIFHSLPIKSKCLLHKPFKGDSTRLERIISKPMSSKRRTRLGRFISRPTSREKRTRLGMFIGKATSCENVLD
jgi:hypothetical protein